MSRFFTADTHFGHQNIIEYDKRPFSTSEEMDEHLIESWNKTISKSDIIYHLGDFSWCGSKLAERILDRLKGQIHLILGNHDNLNRSVLKRFASVSQIKTIKVDNTKIVLCHYALRTWVNQEKGAWNLYGHSHGRLENPLPFATDVGVCCWDWTPVSFGILQRKFENGIFLQK